MRAVHWGQSHGRLADPPRKIYNLWRERCLERTLLGQEFGTKETLKRAKCYQAPYQAYPEFIDLYSEVAGQLAEGEVAGRFRERTEFGPRALGNRPILEDARHPEMRTVVSWQPKWTIWPSVIFCSAKNDQPNYADRDY